MALPRRRGRDWSELPSEILDLFMLRLLFPDCFTFGKVCRSWRSVFFDRRGLRHPPPFLVEAPASDSIPGQLWGLHGNTVRRLKSPTVELLSKQKIVGSFKGWVAITSGYNYKIHLLNPASKQQIPLPSLFSDRVSTGHPNGADRVIESVVLSSSPTRHDCAIVAIVRLWCRDVYYLLRCHTDHKWKYLTNETFSIFQTEYCSVFHKGKLYVLYPNGDVRVSTLKPHTKFSVTGDIPSFLSGKNCCFQRLVQSDGELLLVVRQTEPPVMSVFRNTDDQVGGGWLRVESLGDRVLLIGLHGAESLSTKDLMGSTYQPNCIYYQPYKLLFEKYCMGDGSNQIFTIRDYGDCFSPGFDIFTLGDYGDYFSPGFEWVVPETW